MLRGDSTRIGLLLAAMLMGNAQAGDFDTIWVDAGKSVDVYWNINLSGKVYVAADVKAQEACLDYWWIVWPLGRINTKSRRE